MNATDDKMDCNSTEIIVNKKISLYTQYCPSVHTANFLLSHTSLDLFQILNAIYIDYINNNEDNSSKDNEMQMIITDHEETEMWCILS